MGDFGKKISCKRLSEEKIACSTSVIEKLTGKKGKKYPAHQIARKKILDDQKSQTPLPPQELNGRPQSEERKIAQKVKCARIAHD